MLLELSSVSMCNLYHIITCQPILQDVIDKHIVIMINIVNVVCL